MSNSATVIIKDAPVVCKDCGRNVAFEIIEICPDCAVPLQRPIKYNLPRIGRNDKCRCGSGIKFKSCCLTKYNTANSL